MHTFGCGSSHDGFFSESAFLDKEFGQIRLFLMASAARILYVEDSAPLIKNEEMQNNTNTCVHVLEYY